MLVAIDAVGIRGHGAAAVLSELLTWLPRVRTHWRWHTFLFERSLREFAAPEVAPQVLLEQTDQGNRGWDRLRWVRRQLPERIQSLRPDVVLCMANIGNPRPRRPQVVFCHQPNAFFTEGTSFWTMRRWRQRFMRSQIVRGALSSKAIIVQTDGMRRRMAEIEPRLDGRIHVIPSGYRTPTDHPVVCARKKRFIDSCTRPRLAYVSHPSEHKNHAVLLRALPRIARSFPDVRLLLTLERDDPPSARYARFVRELRQLARRLGMERHVAFLGVLTPDEVNYLLSTSDLMVFPSLAESFGLGIAESMAAGCPVAASDLPYAHDVADEAAVYFDPRDPDSIAQTVVSCLLDPQMIVRLKSSGAKRRHRFSYERIAGSIAQVIEAAAGAQQPPL